MMGSIKNLSIENLIKNLTKILIDKGYINSEYGAYWRYYGLVSKVLKYNRDFLFIYKRSLLDKIMEFQTYADYIYHDMKKRFENSSFKNEYLNRFCLPNYVNNVLISVAYSLYPALLTGYLSHCYSSLRLCVEALGVMYLAEDAPDDWFMRKLERFEKANSSKSTSKILMRVDPKLGDLFSKFSEWLHTSSYLKKVVEYVFKSGELPPRSLGSPMPYEEVDLEELNRLENDINAVRACVPSILEKWHKKIGI